MIIGNCNSFAIESFCSIYYEKLTIMAIGYFVVYIDNTIFGVRKRDASALSSSFYTVEKRIKNRGQHRAPHLENYDGNAIADSFLRTHFDEVDEGELHLGVSATEFEKMIYSADIVWAPDGDEAFDDYSKILQIDEGEKVRLIAFVNTERREDMPETLREIWISASTYYGILEDWHEKFYQEWRASPKKSF